MGSCCFDGIPVGCLTAYFPGRKLRVTSKRNGFAARMAHGLINRALGFPQGTGSTAADVAALTHPGSGYRGIGLDQEPGSTSERHRTRRKFAFAPAWTWTRQEQGQERSEVVLHLALQGLHGSGFKQQRSLKSNVHPKKTWTWVGFVKKSSVV